MAVHCTGLHRAEGDGNPSMMVVVRLFGLTVALAMMHATIPCIIRIVSCAANRRWKMPQCLLSGIASNVEGLSSSAVPAAGAHRVRLFLFSLEKRAHSRKTLPTQQAIRSTSELNLPEQEQVSL